MRRPTFLQRLLREKTLFRYLAAVERADLDAISAIWQRASSDALLEQILLEVHTLYLAQEEQLLHEENGMENDTGTQKSLPANELPSAVPMYRNNRVHGSARWLQVLAAVLLVSVLGGGFLAIQMLRAPHPAPFANLPKYGWCAVPGPGGFNPDYIAPQLNGITAVTASDAWIAGTYNDQSLVEHWDGSHWSIVSTPDLSSSGNYGLSGIAAISTSDVWAVGAISSARQHFQSLAGIHTLIEHWDGARWNVVPSPDGSVGENELRSVSAISANDIWAVGDTSLTTSGFNAYQPLVEHWDGSRWSVAQLPPILNAGDIGWLSEVAAVSANDVWAMGEVTPANYRTYSILMHWDGYQWSLKPAPDTHTGDFLTTITVGSAHDIWADGVGGDATTFYPLIEHWDGTRWSHFPVPHATQGALGGMLALSTSNIWVADRTNVNGQYFETMQHWDGRSWQAVSQQHANDGELLLMAGAGSRLWAIGSVGTDHSNPSVQGPLIETKC